MAPLASAAGSLSFGMVVYAACDEESVPASAASAAAVQVPLYKGADLGTSDEIPSSTAPSGYTVDPKNQNHDDDDDYDDDAPTECSMCKTFRRGPCRPLFLPLQRCMHMDAKRKREQGQGETDDNHDSSKDNDDHDAKDVNKDDASSATTTTESNDDHPADIEDEDDNHPYDDDDDESGEIGRASCRERVYGLV